MDTLPRVEQLATQLLRRQWMLVTAESCSGGLIAGACTDLSGSSNWFERGFVTYSNAAKTEMLGVPADLIARHGAVSEEVARAMAEGALTNTPAHIAVSVTGIAGPDGGSPEKPVGLVYLGVASQGESTRVRECRFGDIGRHEVRLASVREALALAQSAVRPGVPHA